MADLPVRAKEPNKRPIFPSPRNPVRTYSGVRPSEEEIREAFIEQLETKNMIEEDDYRRKLEQILDADRQPGDNRYNDTKTPDQKTRDSRPTRIDPYITRNRMDINPLKSAPPSTYPMRVIPTDEGNALDQLMEYYSNENI